MPFTENIKRSPDKVKGLIILSRNFYPFYSNSNRNALVFTVGDVLRMFTDCAGEGEEREKAMYDISHNVKADSKSLVL